MWMMYIYLDNLGHSVGTLARRQSFAPRSIDEDEFRLPEGADEILSVRGVDGSLSSNTRVYHCKQGSWYLAETDATHAEMRPCSISFDEMNSHSQGGSNKSD